MRLLRRGGNVYNRAIHIRFDLLWEINLLDMPKKVVPFSGIGRWVLTGAELTGYTVGMLMRFIATADTIRFASYWAQGLFWRPAFPGK